jgi:hypothetical protein
LSTLVQQTGCWFLHSGIQEPSGGLARYYRSDTASNAAISNEITGYGASMFAFLHARTRRAEFLDAARQAAAYLARAAWDPAASAFRFEPEAPLAYFFDTGIIARGLLAAARATGEAEFHERARDAALSLAFDFLGEGFFHTVVSLPDKQPLPEEPRWSRQPGCFQLKAAVIWRELEDPDAARMFDMALAMALATHEKFLACETNRAKLMDRLHAYCYFLEALLWAGEHREARSALAAGLFHAAALFRDIAPEFERGDVSAQLLRIRLIAHHSELLPLDEAAAAEEAARASCFQIRDVDDVRLRGGFWFGRRGAAMLPFANPVSAAFCAQALALWEDHRTGRWNFELAQLI